MNKEYYKKWIIYEKNILESLNFTDDEINKNFDINLYKEKFDLITIKKNIKLNNLEEKYNNIINNIYKSFYEEINRDLKLFSGSNIDNITIQHNLYKNYIHCKFDRMIEKIE